MLEISELSRKMSASAKLYPLRESKESDLLEMTVSNCGAISQEGIRRKILCVVAKNVINN